MDEAGVLAAIKQARAQCDLLVVSIHWGIEYAPAPRPEDVEMAHKMLDAGASVLAGHGRGNGWSGSKTCCNQTSYSR